ncbi:transcription factor bHLH121 [Vicia villosa]|uniref:transcription factor bHLH121 n=1 Tax=Vicia villosa TaxID=3911 RepID=UPI00273C8ABD|nr:transcription factor bHLH121 [Vicia villosa]XP_058730266.1 transcription factor bHLH121 [Vicia villosa]XP_058730267.1 transcription factor bHLH121 [Vicia villosa]XP_058730268.1 transcription factor bHLH121 [Vicia villosa]XP_058730270.1 transcription factor bHLH121 [Vicia villosa]XP_058730271.1 transcription factor bHLH121 [Vicia villosa]XP_058730272.1 transcription factor bHLH121 [Vicia villosa]XP_058730273.1 transcription factor bHLH121 [Vicia villosa]
MECTPARKTQKADREKLRRDRLNEQFVELGSILDPDRPKNDKATILGDTVQLLKDLTSQVSKLKDEYTMLNEESRELSQEKNDLREEKASLKSDIENLNNQYQLQLRTMYPWPAMDHSVMMAPPSYPYPVPMPVPPPGSIPMQPYPYYANQHPAIIPNPCSTYVPFLAPNTIVEQQSTQYVSPPLHPGSRSHISGKQESKNKSSRESRAERHADSNDVATDLELKTPGSSADQDLSSAQKKSSKSPSRKENSYTDGSSLGKCSSSHSVQDSSSSSVVGSRKASE